MSSKVVKSLFMSIISTLFLTLCISIAWFYAIRQNQAENSSFNVVRLDGDLYYFSENCHKVKDDNGQEINEFSGYNKDKVLNFGPDNFLNEASYTYDPAYTFNKYDRTATTGGPFLMQNTVPGNRFLFLVKCRHSFNEPMNAKLNLLNWTSTWLLEGETKKSNGQQINLTEAIYFYTLGAFVSSDNPKAISDAANSPDLVNKFVDTNGHNITTATNESGVAVKLDEYVLNPNVEYYIPFIMSFSSDKDTFYSFDGVSNYVKDPINGDSNVYSNGEFKGIKIELTNA